MQREDRVDGYQPIENYGVIGDMHTVALVGMDASIDYMCFPSFDSPTIFAALLDRERGGHFKIAPVFTDSRQKQMYLSDTNVLITRFLANDGVAEVSDFMPVECAGWVHDLVRRAKTVRGEITYRMTCAPKFDYGRSAHDVVMGDGEVLFVPARRDLPTLRLRTPVPVRIEAGAAVAEFTLHAGETAAFVLEEVTGEPSASGDPAFVADAFKRTVNYWRAWMGRSRYRGRWREMVNRSALVLKLMTSQLHGSIVAAPTFGLPEQIGGVRNWDYRYTWIRDASFTIYALLRLGFTDEARQFMQWLEDRVKELPDGGALQVMYGVDGRSKLDEETLSHFGGYRDSVPVRIGNGAYGQLQLDIYGELMDSIYLYDKWGEQIHWELWESVVRLVDWVAGNYAQKDEGIWETRGGRQHFLYSRLMCWVALDRGLRLADKRSLPAPRARWLAVRDEIYREIQDKFYDPALGAYVQHLGSKTLDAAALAMPLMRFVSPTDQRWLSTLAAIDKELVEDSLVYRYRRRGEIVFDDGLSGEEGTFSICSFWYVECLSRSGDLLRARHCFEKMLGYANHLGLYAEQLGPRGEHLGNFPQAFTHIALISAAFDLDRRLDQSGQKA
jgi:GH15 family glucan-1,4-alpha-glucosidase